MNNAGFIIFALVDSYNNIKLRQAAKHWNGAGMSDGIDVQNTFALDRCKHFR